MIELWQRVSLVASCRFHPLKSPNTSIVIHPIHPLISSVISAIPRVWWTYLPSLRHLRRPLLTPWLRQPPQRIIDILLIDDDAALATSRLGSQFAAKAVDVKVAFFEVWVVLKFVPTGLVSRQLGLSREELPRQGPKASGSDGRGGEGLGGGG